MCEQEQEVCELGQTAADTGRAEQRSHSRSDWTESWPGMVAPRPHAIAPPDTLRDRKRVVTQR